MKTIISVFFILCFNYLANAQDSNYWSSAKPDDMEALIESDGFKILKAWDGLPGEFNNTVIKTKSAFIGEEETYDPKETVIINQDGIKNLHYSPMSCQSVIKTYSCTKDNITYKIFVGNNEWTYAIADAPGTQMIGYIANIKEMRFSPFASYEISISATDTYIKSVEEKADNTGEVTDIDGNVYKTVKIGEQIWMAENLRTKRFADGAPIPTITKGLDKLKKAEKPVYQWAFNNDESNVEYFGRLYTGWVIIRGNVCPTEWHVPDENEWNTLIDYLGGEDVAGGKLKYPSEKLWSDIEDAKDEVWFKAAGAGFLDFEFRELKMSTSYYTKSGSAWYLIGTSGPDIFYRNYETQGWSYIGRSIRCIKD